MIEFLLLFIFLIIASFFIFRSKIISTEVKIAKKQYNIPDGKIIYTDLNRPAKALFSKELGLVGKPDYIVKQGETYIPVEIKTTKTDEPFRNHILQLATYCTLLEKKYNRKVPYGVIDYNGRQHIIPFDKSLKDELNTTVKKMRTELKNNDIQRNHSHTNRCTFCSFNNICNQKIE